jgi:hypothetical protein
VTFRGVFEKLTSHVQSNICNSLKPAQTELKPNANQFSELSKDVRHIKERALYGELKKNDANLHSFVYRVMLTLTREDNRNSVQGLIDLCVHAVSQCKGLNAEFLGALRAMACPAEKKYGYSALLDAMNVSYILSQPVDFSSYSSVLSVPFAVCTRADCSVHVCAGCERVLLFDGCSSSRCATFPQVS